MSLKSIQFFILVLFVVMSAKIGHAQQQDVNTKAPSISWKIEEPHLFKIPGQSPSTQFVGVVIRTQNDREYYLSGDSTQVTSTLNEIMYPDPNWCTFGLDNGVASAEIASRKIPITFNGNPWVELTDLGPVEAKESPIWKFRSAQKHMPAEEGTLTAQLLVTTKDGRTLASKTASIAVKQYVNHSIPPDRTEEYQKDLTKR